MVESIREKEMGANEKTATCGQHRYVHASGEKNIDDEPDVQGKEKLTYKGVICGAECE